MPPKKRRRGSSRSARHLQVVFSAYPLRWGEPAAFRRHYTPNLRGGETTIKIEFSLLRGVGLGGREENRPNTLFFVGSATTPKFESANFIVEKFCCHWQAPTLDLQRPFFLSDNSIWSLPSVSSLSDYSIWSS